MHTPTPVKLAGVTVLQLLGFPNANGQNFCAHVGRGAVVGAGVDDVVVSTDEVVVTPPAVVVTGTVKNVPVVT